MVINVDHDLFLAIPIVFMVIVAPLWLVLHYATKMRASKALTQADEQTLSELWALSDKLEQRIVSLETILDAEVPGWRNKQ